MKADYNKNLEPLKGESFAIFLQEALTHLDRAISRHNDMEKLLTPQFLPFFYQQQILLSETKSLISGVIGGYIKTGQPRIRDNLLEFTQLFNALSIHTEHAAPIQKDVLEFLSYVTLLGVTAEHQQLNCRTNPTIRTR